MKIYIFFIICFLCILNNWNAFFWWTDELDLYNNIYDWIDELENKMTFLEAKWWENWEWIWTEINKKAKIKWKKECLDWNDISHEDFKDISLNGNIEKLNKYISEECKSENWNISNNIIIDYLGLFNDHYEESKNTSQKKSKKIYNISRIWLYSDWILENSGFDLILDIEEIDKIIFSDVKDYEWKENIDLEEEINSALWSDLEYIEDIIESENENQLNTNIYTLKKYKPTVNNWEELNDLNNENIWNYTVVLTNQYICNENIKNNNLWNEEIEKIEKYLNWINNSNISNDSFNNINNSNESNNNNSNISISEDNTIDNSSSYNKVTDNSQWPCNDFFCIEIEFETYQHTLFWWSENITIEYLINRSNKHLSEFAWTSLIQSKMTTNYFELWLKDLNLPSIFHMSTQVTTKPIPILNIEDENKEDESEFASKNLLDKYYELSWLEYERRNDLSLLKAKDQDKQSLLSSWELPIWNHKKNLDEYKKYSQKQEDKKEIIEKSVEKEVSYWILDNFVLQYNEIERFTLNIYDYVESINGLIKKMREIPIDKW